MALRCFCITRARPSHKKGAGLEIFFAFIIVGPRIMSTPQEKEVNEGEPTSFRCDAVGNPLPSVLWRRAGDEQIIAEGDTITIDNVRSWQQGEYICTAVVDGFRDASMSHFLYIRGAPVIIVPAEVTANAGESTEIPCLVSGRPKPLEIHWTKNGKPLNHATGRTQVSQREKKSKQKATAKYKQHSQLYCR
ncbi:immunoglobulin domain protein [Cooperia oncophora]